MYFEIMISEERNETLCTTRDYLGSLRMCACEERKIISRCIENAEVNERMRNEVGVATRYTLMISRAFLNANEINHRYHLINPLTSIRAHANHSDV